MSYFITGTDTDVGKTIACCWLMLQIKDAHYWKPVQAGQEERDLETVSLITELDRCRFLPSAYNLSEPLSPHESARREDIEIDMKHLKRPAISEPLIVEGAGGVLVPLNRKILMIDLIKRLGLPVILVARTSLGTINHTLMSLEVLRNRDIEIAGIILNGNPSVHNRKAIEYYGNSDILVEIPLLNHLDIESLKAIRPLKKLTY